MVWCRPRSIMVRELIYRLAWRSSLSSDSLRSISRCHFVQSASRPFGLGKIMVPVLASPGVLRVTRVLCSAVYVDNDFAGQAAFLWRRRDLRAVAPSVGIDLRPLLRHSLAALRSKRIYRRRLLG